MQHEKKTFKLPLSLIVLDAIGAIFIGLGVAKMYAGLDLFPAALQLDEKGWTFIIVGILLMLPLMLHLFANMREQAEKRLTK